MKVDDTVWCNDKTNVTDTTFNPWLDVGNATGLGYGTNTTYYGTTQRLYDADRTGPSLKCNGELSKITSKIGLITADELAFAGHVVFGRYPTTYLEENATDTFWWSLSPDAFSDGYAYVWVVSYNLGLTRACDYKDYTGSVRPSISLKPSTNVTGDGTSSSPFVVKI